MTQPTPNQEPSPEVRATPGQAQDILDQVDRITRIVTILPGLEGIRNNSAPHKVRWHEKKLFVRYPEGESNVDDPNVTNLACVAWDNEDGSRSSYQVEIADSGLQVTKHTFPPTRQETSDRHMASMKALASGDYASVAIHAAADLAEATRDRQERMQKRALGLHFASQSEAAQLIAELEQTSPAAE